MQQSIEQFLGGGASGEAIAWADSLAVWARVVLFAGGVVFLLFGRIIHELLIWLTGFAVGLAIGVVATHNAELLTQIAVSVLAGLLGGGLAILLVALSLFLVGAFVGAVATTAVCVGVTGEMPPALLIALCSLVGGFATIRLWVLYITVSSAMSGAVMVLIAVGEFPNPPATLLLAAVGTVGQYALARRLCKPESEPESPNRPRSANRPPRVDGRLSPPIAAAVPAAALAQAPPAAGSPVMRGGPSSVRVRARLDDHHRCPFCREQSRKVLVICEHCGMRKR